MLEENSDEQQVAVMASAPILKELMVLYDDCGLHVASAYLSRALDIACQFTGLDRSALIAGTASPDQVSGTVN